MSNATLRCAFRLEMRYRSAKAVLIALTAHANEQGTCWPSIARLRRFTAPSERTVQRAPPRLAALSAIETALETGRRAAQAAFCAVPAMCCSRARRAKGLSSTSAWPLTSSAVMPGSSR